MPLIDQFSEESQLFCIPGTINRDKCAYKEVIAFKMKHKSAWVDAAVSKEVTSMLNESYLDRT